MVSDPIEFRVRPEITPTGDTMYRFRGYGPGHIELSWLSEVFEQHSSANRDEAFDELKTYCEELGIEAELDTLNGY